MVGSNNNLEPGTCYPLDPGGYCDTGSEPETAPQAAIREQEWYDRNNANLQWLEDTFEMAELHGALGVVLFLHADMYHPDDRADGALFDGHQQFVETLAALAEEFDRPVLIISGDSHNYRVDPGVPWFSLYGVAPQPSITQIIVDRSIEDDSVWLRLHVDPRGPDLFSWEQVTVQ